MARQMTESMWLNGNNITPMLIYLDSIDLRRKTKNRRFRLFSCACCRRIWHLIDNNEYRKAVESAEEYADAKVDFQVLRPLQRRIRQARVNVDSTIETLGEGYDPGEEEEATLQRNSEILGAIECVVRHDQGASFESAAASASSVLELFDQEYYFELSYQCSLLRDIFGNPFRPVTIDRAWLTTNVIQTHPPPSRRRPTCLRLLDIREGGKYCQWLSIPVKKFEMH